MKKLFTLIAAFTTLAATAQYSTTTSASKVADKKLSSYKPVAGTVTAEFGLGGGLLNSNLGLNNNEGLLRFRYFTAKDMAFRIGLAVNNNSSTDNYYGGPNNSQSGSRVRKNSGITFNLGVEKHLTGSERLSTYVGADLLISLDAASEKWDNSNGTNYVLGLKREITGFNTVAGGTNGGSGFGLRLVTGAEYYIVKNVYIGGELGFGFLSSKFKDIKDQTTTTVTVGVNTTTTIVNNDRKTPGKNFNISPSVITGVRIGFQF
jgi:hypothetical protein